MPLSPFRTQENGALGRELLPESPGFPEGPAGPCRGAGGTGRGVSLFVRGGGGTPFLCFLQGHRHEHHHAGGSAQERHILFCSPSFCSNGMNMGKSIASVTGIRIARILFPSITDRNFVFAASWCRLQCQLLSPQSMGARSWKIGFNTAKIISLFSGKVVKYG